MNEAVSYGNVEWYVFVMAAYAVVAVAVLAYVAYSLKVRGDALRALKDEGFLADEKSGEGVAR